MWDANTIEHSWIYATREAHFKTLLLILEDGMNVNIVNHDGNTLLTLLCTPQGETLPYDSL